MSEDLIAIVRSGYDALNRGDTEGWIRLLDPEVEVHDLAEAPELGIYRRPEGVRRWLEQQQEVFDEFLMEPTETVVYGDVVLVALELQGRGRGSSAPATLNVFHVLEMRNGRLLRLRGFLDEAGARRAAAEADASDPPV